MIVVIDDGRGKCPVCGKDIETPPALSRYENSFICRDCGTLEALVDMEFPDETTAFKMGIRDDRAENFNIEMLLEKQDD